uniref:F-box and leucine rich repeat protein 15 n=1 Tax=Molossus molossus TaxID=27622 RepID=A0A7J8DNW2_MOLMO|nr:F-box and leucine rich repeat protein 15 [Molossus molossus]
MEPSGGEQEPGAVRLLDLPWEDVLLPHVLSRVPLCQLLRLQRVSRAFRALVQLHLAGLRSFDAAQVSRWLEPRPHLGTAPTPPPAQSPVPLSALPDPLGPPGVSGKRCIQREVLSKNEYRVLTQRARRVSPGRAGRKPLRAGCCQKRSHLGRIVSACPVPGTS